MTERAGHAYDTLSSLSDIELKAFDGVIAVVRQLNSNSLYWSFYHLIFSQIYRPSGIAMMPSHLEQFILQETDKKLSVKCMCHLFNKLKIASIHVSTNIPPS